MIERAADTVDHLVDDLVTAGIPTTETIPVRRQHFDLAETARAIIDGAPGGRADVAVDVPATAMVYADERAVTRIITNLLDNARRHGEPPITLAIRADTTEVVIEVTNAGHPIPAEVRPHLFTRFRPGSAATSGTGLGLHIVQRLAAAHHGTVELLDRPGLTSLVVSLPQRAPSR